MSLNEKLLAVQAKAIALQKDAINPHFGNRYITLDSVLETVMPVLTEHGLILDQACEIMTGTWGYTNVVTSTLTDSETGEWKSSAMALGYETNPQRIGSAVTYARRYTLLALLALTADEDDDAERASEVYKAVDANIAKAATSLGDGRF